LPHQGDLILYSPNCRQDLFSETHMQPSNPYALGPGLTGLGSGYEAHCDHNMWCVRINIQAVPCTQVGSLCLNVNITL
jgi:hypothetical protein